MRGALLRSGKSGMFTALGETGQPVYRAALQLREAIRRKNPEMVDHLAIPQSDELGNQIDWYSGLEGDVIPWSSATEEERAPARVQLEAFKKSLDELSLRFLGTDPAEQQGDKAVFGKLLKRVIHFPDENFVYLVNGKPVLTFWGFEHAGADRTLDPLHCLYPAASPATAPVPPVIAPVDVTPPPVVKRSWWRRWWWLLPLLLLLLLLLFGLRGCWGLNVTIYPAGTLPPAEPVVEVPQVAGTDPTLHAVSTTGLSTAGTSVVENGVVGTNGAVVPALAEKDTATAAAAEVAGSGADSAAQPNADVAGTPPDAAPAAESANPPAVPQNPAQTKTPGPALSIPPTAADGAADFLNGQYRAGAGIQDRRTGKPLRLDYQFKDGKGEVTVHQANGVNCTGPVTAAMKGGSLSIDSQGQAVCADGSHYDMPKVDCRKGATSVADCTGGYGKEQFPMSMRQAGE